MIKPDPYKAYMNRNCEVQFFDQPINEISLNALMPFSDGGAFKKSFDVTVKGKREFEEVFIVSSIAKYSSENGDIPAVQVRVIDDNGQTLYYSPVYEIGHKREFYRREWRIPPTYKRYDTVRLSFIIPEGVTLWLEDIRIKHNYGFRERDFGIRYHGHGGCTAARGFQLTAEVGFTSCITIPKFTKDGIAVCFHDDETVTRELRYDDGTSPEPGSKYDKPVSEFTYDELCELNVWRHRSDIFTGMRVPTMDDYFRICSSTGMQPIFSVHPALTEEQWRHVRELLIKYRLLDQFWVKSGQVNTQKICLKVFGEEIAGHILIFGAKNLWDPTDLANEIGFDRQKNKVVVEYFNGGVTDEKIAAAKAGGFPISIAAMSGGISGPRMTNLIEEGVTEFTVDHHCSMGLSW